MATVSRRLAPDAPRGSRGPASTLLVALLAALTLVRPAAQDARPFLAAEEPGTARDGRLLLVAVPLVNVGTGPAEQVTLTAISLNGQPALRPARLPVRVGDLASGDEVVLQLAFSLDGLERDLRYRLEIEGTHQVSGRERPFSVARGVDRPPPEEGVRRTRDVTVEPRIADGAVFPPSETEERIEAEPRARPLPIGRRTGDGPDNPGVRIAEAPAEAVPFDGTTGAAGEVSFVRVSNEPLKHGTSGDTKNGFPWDPSGASVDHDKGEQVIFLTGNLYALLSIDGGATFAHLDPTTIFGNIPLDGLPQDEGLCCDMNMIYVPSLDRFVWVLLTKGSQVGWRRVEVDGKWKFAPVNGLNRLRVATATTQQVIASGGTYWAYWDMTTAMFGLGEKAFLDYPDVSSTGQSLHISVSDTSTGGLLVTRVPLSDIQSGGAITIGYTNPGDSTSAFSARLAHDATDAAYWFGHAGTENVVIFEWLDGAGFYSWRTRAIAPWLPGDYTSIVADGQTNWLRANTTAIRGATVRGDTAFGAGVARTMLVAWSAGRGGPFPRPYVRLLPITRSTLGTTTNWTAGQSSQIWHPEIAFNHAHLATNANREIGVSVGAASATSHATPAAGFVGDPVLYVTGVSSTSIDIYGDYTAIRPHRPNAKLFMVSDYFLEGNGMGYIVRHQYRLFGRSADVN